MGAFPWIQGFGTGVRKIQMTPEEMVAKGDNTPEGLVAVQTNLTSRSGYVGTKSNHRHKDFSSDVTLRYAKG
jgi:hypothetical protein